MAHPLSDLYSFRLDNARGEIVARFWGNHFRLHIMPVNKPTQYYAFPKGDPRIKTIMDALRIG